MKSLLSLLLIFSASTARADWPQWRGPDRNGIAAADSDLPELLPEGYEPTRRWESLEIPSDHYGGHGSISIADGKVYLSVVWHRDEPTDTRKIDRDVLATLGYRGLNSIPEEIRRKMENDRLSLSRRLRGAALDEWAENWVKENIEPKTQLSLGSWIISRFKKGKAAVPLNVYDNLLGASKQTFKNQSELEAWIDAQNFDPAIREQVLKAVPATVKKADDIILCLDSGTGEVLWEFRQPGIPSGRSSSSTPAVSHGLVFAALSEHLYCVDAESGEEIWRAPLSGKKGPASSPLVHGDSVYLQQNFLTAFDLNTGEEQWRNAEVTGANSSPATWKDLILCNTSKALFGIDRGTGATVWKAQGGGDGTPVVSGDDVIISSKDNQKNLIAYHLNANGPEEKWSHQFLARRYGSSPIIFEGYVYYMGSERHLCLDLGTGEIQWEREAQSSLSSPILADGKLVIYENKGGFAHLIKASPESYQSLGRVKVGALYCASPATVGKDIYLRTSKSVVSFRFD
ncbi:MAG: PQQ-like beta-propeller repeat protein [Verrucomicrobiales bacterium]|nr:PQQ-like beta-propeller repeat protein [Verrucomicrobiales bacterium]